MKSKLPRALAAAGVCFALTFLLSSARFPWGLSPFYLVVYASLLAAGENYFLLSAAYLLSRFACGGSVTTLLQAAFAVAGVGAAIYLPRLFGKKTHSFYMVICAFFAELPTMCFLPTDRLFLFLANSALACLFALLGLGFVKRGVRGVWAAERGDALLALLWAFAFGAGSYGVLFYGVTPYYLLLAFLLPVSASVGAEGGTIPLSFALGATAVSGDIYLSLSVAAAWVLAEALRGNRRIAAFSVVVAEGATRLAGVSHLSLLNFPLMLSGALVAAFLPASFYHRLGARLGKSESSAARAIVNKARLDVAGKVGFVASALRNVSESLSAIGGEEDADGAATRLSVGFARELCGGCKGYRDCAAQGGGGTAPLFEGALSHALTTGRATICDLPAYLNGNCHKIKPLLDKLNEAAALYLSEKERSASLGSEREWLSSETEGIAGVLDALKKDARRVVTFDGKREKRVLAELRRAGVTAYDAMVTEEGEKVGVTVTMEGEGAEDPRVTRAVSHAMDIPLIPESVSALGAGMHSISFEIAPTYDAIVGYAVRIKEGSEACGDTKTVTRLCGDRIMVALSDGMGSGAEANRGSGAAISLVENFYRTGVDERVILPLVNRLLTIRNDGTFQTLDMCVVNLRTGVADFIKLSAPESVIKRKEGCEIVEGGALPLGILREVKPSVSRRKLSAGDVVVLSTDGVTDAIGADGVVRVVECGKTNNPQTIADNIVRDASYVSDKDDQTVVALRLFHRL